MTLLQTRITHTLVDNDIILPKFITKKVLGLFQTWLLTLLEYFLAVQIKKKRKVLSKNHNKNLNVTLFLLTRIAPIINEKLYYIT